MKRVIQTAGVLFLLVVLWITGCSSSTVPPVFEPPDQDLAPENTPEEYTWTPLEPEPGSLVLVETTTNSVFNLRGEAIAGPLAEARRLLRQMPGVNMFWFAWSVFYPGSEIWGTDDLVRQAALPEEKTGVSACFGGIDCIPSLPNTGPPAGDLNWTTPETEDAAYLQDGDLVMGVFERGVARAFPHNILWWHEVANDYIGEQFYTVTFCPLTGSGLVFEADEAGYTFGVSGNLFNSNLVLYDHQTESLWPQLWTGAVAGSEEDGPWLKLLPHSEMTWGRWKELHPETLVLSEETGFSRDYTAYPYGDYRTNNASTFRTTDPLPDPLFENKQMTFGLIDKETGDARSYVHDELEEQVGTRGVIEDEFTSIPIVVAFDLEDQLVIAFRADTADGVLTFEAGAYEP